MNKIVIELSQEDRALLTKLSLFLGEIRDELREHHDCKTCVDAVTKAMDKLGEAAPETPKTAPETNEKPQTEELPPVEEKTPAEVKTEPQPEPKAVSLQELQAKVISLCQAGKKPQVTEVIHRYATSASSVPEEKRAEVLELLIQLEG